MTTQQNIIRKIRALLARADENRNDNEHEREIAMRQAEKLMAMHAIDASDIDTSDIERPGTEQVKTGASLWRASIVGAIAKLYGCASYRTSGRNGTTKVIGRQADRMVVLSIAAWIMESIDREARNTCQGRRESRAFRVGANAGVWRQVRQILRERRESADRVAGTALVVADYYASQLTINDRHMRSMVRLRSGSGMSHSSTSGYARGRAYGESVNLSRQVAGAGQRRLGNGS